MTAASGALMARSAAWLSRHPRLAVAVALFLPPVVLLRDAVLGLGVLYERDVHLYWHAEAESFVRAVFSGAWPVWDATVGFGQPFLANSSAQVLYPITWLNLVIRPWWYYTLFVFVHLVFSGLGAYLAGRRLACSRPAALVGALVWTASGPFVSLTILWHHFAGAAWLPWIFLAAHVLGVARSVRAALGLAVALAGQQLAGSFDMSAMGSLVAAAVILAAPAWPRPWSSASDRRLLALAAGGFVLALGLSAGQWVATAEAASYSGRRSLPRDVRTYWSVHPLSVADLALPGFSRHAQVSKEVRAQLFEGREPFLASLYLGLTAAFLVAAAFLDRERRRICWLLAASGLLALLVALGRHLPVYDILVAAVPPLKAFRYPVKAMVLVALPWSLLSAIGVDVWRRLPDQPWSLRPLRVISAVIALAALAAGGALAVAGADRAARNTMVAGGLAGFAAAAAGWGMRARIPRAAAAAIVSVVAVADLVFYHRSLNAVAATELYTHRPEVLGHIGASPPARVYAYDYSVAPAADVMRPASAQRIARTPAGWPLGPATALAQQMALAPISGSRWGLRGSFEVDYTGLFPIHVNQAAYFLRSLEGTAAHLRLLQLGGVTHVVATHGEPFGDLLPLATIPGLYEAPIRLFSVPSPMPHSFVATRTRAGEGIPGLKMLADPAFDFRSEALIPASAPPAHGTGARGASRVVVASPDRLKVEVDAPEGGYLVILDSHAPGWRATVDGRPALIVPANVLFRGIRLEPGARVVEMVYRPRGLVAGLAVSALSVFAAVGIAWWTAPGRAAAAGRPA